jgi:hypothetical protein
MIFQVCDKPGHSAKNAIIGLTLPIVTMLPNPAICMV